MATSDATGSPNDTPPFKPSQTTSDDSIQNLSSSKLQDSTGFDGKLRVRPNQVILTNPEALSDPDWSDENAPSTEQIEADEDLLDDYPLNTEDIDCVHCRITSIPALRLDRFTSLQKLCLRQNQISDMDFPSIVGNTLLELDLYDNLISHIQGLESFVRLTSLDLSFNKIKHIQNVHHLKELKDLYFVQNRVQKIENLEGLSNLKMIELAANRIREMDNLNGLTSLEELWLGKNKITEIKNISSLTRIRLLDVKSNRLTLISGVESLSELEELYVSHNAIRRISGLESNPKLRVLDISNNQISKLENVSHLKHLEEFWASSNQLSSFEEVSKELEDKEELQTVYFESNPLQTKSPALYRNKIRLALPQVQQIDASKLSDSSQPSTR
jgi:protein phosphatase 1 regulatory subunit 7